MCKTGKFKIVLLMSVMFFVILSIYSVWDQQSNKISIVTTNTTTSIVVESKEQSEEKSDEYSVVVSNPNNNEEDFVLLVENVNVWNLISSNTEYFVTYSTNSNGDNLLEYIKPVN